MAGTAGVLLRQERCAQSVLIVRGLEEPGGTGVVGCDSIATMGMRSGWYHYHLGMLLEHGEHDVVYGRWAEGEGVFPYSPFDRDAFLSGLDFVGTDVLLRTEAVPEYDEWPGLLEVLRQMARDGADFKAIDAVTYVRGA